MRILKEEFNVNKAVISQTQEGTKLIFNNMTTATGAKIQLSQLKRTISDITPTDLNGVTGYTFTVQDTKDMYDTIALLGTYGYDIIQG